MWQRLQVKYREGEVDRVEPNGIVIVKNMFKRETDLQLFVGMPVMTNRAMGRIEGPFGKTGKVRVQFGAGFENIAAGDTVAMVNHKFLFR